MFDIAKPASEARAVSAVADGVGCGLCALTRAWRGEAAEPPTHSIADGTALRNIVGEEVAATLRTSEIRLGGSFFV